MIPVNFFRVFSQSKRFFSTKSNKKFDVVLYKEIEHGLSTEQFKHKKHPGILQIGNTSIPEKISKAVNKCLKDFPYKTLQKESENLSRYLQARHFPIEEYDYYQKRKEITEKVEVQYPQLQNEDLNEVERVLYKNQIIDKVNRILKQRIYNWEPMVYDSFKARQYLIGQAPKEYASLLKIFTEIQKRESVFEPKSFLDFGSGVGSGIWAVSNLWNNIYEYVLIDSSREMNDLADLLLRDGDENKESTLKNVYFRQFLPSSGPKYDIVLCAYTLFELPSQHHREEILLNLWDKCDKYLIIAEQGTRNGFKLINEAKQFLIEKINNNNEEFDIFSPCPHKLSCPRYEMQDRIPCNFEVSYKNISLEGQEKYDKFLYSYVVFRKGSKCSEHWPRIIKPTLVKARHTICRMCCSDGKLNETIFTASKHGKDAYRCARSTRWGDRLPIELIKKI